MVEIKNKTKRLPTYPGIFSDRPVLEPVGKDKLVDAVNYFLLHSNTLDKGKTKANNLQPPATLWSQQRNFVGNKQGR